MKRLKLFFPVIIALLCSSQAALADGFGINATRLIYPQAAGSIAVTVRNTQPALPYLVQATVSRNQSSRDATPFTVTPPIFRLEAKSENQIRITGDGTSLPKDRESVFYFQAMAVPAAMAPTASQQNANMSATAQFGVGNIIKLFYRPTGLPANSAAAQKNLRFTRVNNGLQVSNSSPYFVSLASIVFAGKALTLETPEALMIAPFSSHTYPTIVKKGVIDWQTINDQGGVDAFKQTLP